MSRLFAWIIPECSSMMCFDCLFFAISIFQGDRSGFSSVMQLFSSTKIISIENSMKCVCIERQLGNIIPKFSLIVFRPKSPMARISVDVAIINSSAIILLVLVCTSFFIIIIFFNSFYRI